jgi:hypothetical protein
MRFNMPKKKGPTLSDIAFHEWLPKINFEDDELKTVSKKGGTGPKCINAKNAMLRTKLERNKNAGT